MIVSIWRSLLAFICWQKINLILHVFFEILQRYCKLVIFGTLGIPGYAHPQWCYQLEEIFVFIYRQNIKFTPIFYWRYCKDMQTSYFGYFEYAWLRTPKMIVSTCRNLWCLSPCQKYTSSFTSFLRYYILKNLAIWLAHKLRTNINQ